MIEAEYQRIDRSDYEWHCLLCGWRGMFHGSRVADAAMVKHMRSDHPTSKVATKSRDSIGTGTDKFVREVAKLPDRVLIAPGGWCAPNETLSDLLEASIAQRDHTHPEENMPTTDPYLAKLQAQLAAERADRDRIERRINELQAEITATRYPTEPEAIAIVFTKVLRTANSGRKAYDYAGRRASNGRWYLTGSNHPTTGYTWHGILDFIRRDNLEERPVIWYMTDSERLDVPLG